MRPTCTCRLLRLTFAHEMRYVHIKGFICGAVHQLVAFHVGKQNLFQHLFLQLCCGGQSQE